ncbi:MAG: PEP-CTERM sorting domain-containing protein [Acetobacteraceae bacterium]
MARTRTGSRRSALVGSILAAMVGAAALLLGSVGTASAQGFTVTINVDENGNGHFMNSSGFMSALPFALLNDPGPGGLNNVLTYSLLNPPGLTAGDLLLTDADAGGAFLDVVRFNPTQTCSDGSMGCLVFYSDNVDGFDSLADTPSPPGSFYANTLSIPEVGPEGNNGAIYTPVAGQPGFVAGSAGPVTYIIVSDAPEPASMLLLGVGVLGLAAFRRRH